MRAIPDGSAYQLVLVLHLVAVIVGFGGLMLARFVTPAPLTVTDRWVEWFVYAVPVLGIVLVLLSEDRWHFSQAWIGASLAAYVAALAIHQAVLRPERRRHPEQAPSRRAQIYGALFDVLWIAAVVLMVVKPGA